VVSTTTTTTTTEAAATTTTKITTTTTTTTRRRLSLVHITITPSRSDITEFDWGWHSKILLFTIFFFS
jgi:hypothetical protein